MSIRRFLITNLLLILLVALFLMLGGDYILFEMDVRFRKEAIIIAMAIVIIFPILGFIAFFLVQKALSSLTKIMKEVADRKTSYLEPVELSNVPKEVKPLVEEINKLLFRLKQGFEREKRFAADAAHELRTPLAALKTQAQVALKAKDMEIRQSALQHVIEGVDRSTHLVQQLLTFSRLMTQTETIMEMSEISLHKLAVDVIANMAPQSIDKQVDIELLPENEKNIIKGNTKALNILITNLVDNAIRYSSPKDAIFVSVEKKEKQVILKVSDNGKGIPEELRDRLFERFFRVLGNDTSGSGLGFAIIEQVAKLHKAEIKIATPSSGKGLEVSIIFPLIVSNVS